MKRENSSTRTTGRLLSGSIALLALFVTSCTSTGTGTGTGLDGKPLQLAAGADSSMIADTLQSAADQTVAAENLKAKADEPGATKPTATANTSSTDTDNKETAKADADASSEAREPTELTALAPQPQKTSLFSMFGNGKSAEAKPDESAGQIEKPQETAATAEKQTEPAKAQDVEAAKPAQAAEKPIQVSSLFGSSKTAYASAQRPTASQGSIARLFSDESTGARSGRVENKKLAVIKPVSSTTATHDYNYSLPGVRPNGGIEIKHRNSLYDDSDIDANEDDEFASVTLASAPGLARLAPNGLKVQRQTVDVACLKPELVTMLKTMERHFRRPVMVTSGYRSPSYNRKVNGARRSLHMICAAADIQIDGVSKWEIARFARSMPRRGGVGTYCHTTSVHVDVGPERDWNWRCKG
ncbi:YcbK family protein [Brucella sp. 2280]|uniref:YcbK family protein n=1 Tax=Brucella sp. 2280 TaxID=2592625 RepID=UPI0012966045|nr:YcbK family protein [Brucella sp. 2280]QGA56083.1 DUF882 domain-containing protein [Brucella sp. 2280]